MPGWSPEIANEFIRLAARDGRAFDQQRLQHLVYIAHGWCLATYDLPLTADRPGASEFGPSYGRLEQALSAYGDSPVTRLITKAELFLGFRGHDIHEIAIVYLNPAEAGIIEDIYANYGELEARQMSELACKRGKAPWKRIYANGAGKGRAIAHKAIQDQFLELMRLAELNEPATWSQVRSIFAARGTRR